VYSVSLWIGMFANRDAPLLSYPVEVYPIVKTI
jgi:hypothetical protein